MNIPFLFNNIVNTWTLPAQDAHIVMLVLPEEQISAALHSTFMLLHLPFDYYWKRF